MVARSVTHIIQRCKHHPPKYYLRALCPTFTERCKNSAEFLDKAVLITQSRLCVIAQPCIFSAAGSCARGQSGSFADVEDRITKTQEIMIRRAFLESLVNVGYRRT